MNHRPNNLTHNVYVLLSLLQSPVLIYQHWFVFNFTLFHKSVKGITRKFPPSMFAQYVNPQFTKFVFATACQENLMLNDFWRNSEHMEGVDEK